MNSRAFDEFPNILSVLSRHDAYLLPKREMMACFETYEPMFTFGGEKAIPYARLLDRPASEARENGRRKIVMSNSSAETRSNTWFEFRAQEYLVPLAQLAPRTMSCKYR